MTTNPAPSTPSTPAAAITHNSVGIAPPKAAPTPKKRAAPVEDGDEREATLLEIAIAKAERKFSDLGHIETKAAIIQYMFPILRALAKEQGDTQDVVGLHEEEIDDLHTAFDAGALGVDGDTQIDALDLAFQTMAQLGVVLDETMVTAGFYTVNRDTGALEPTKKVPRGLHMKYAAIVEQVGKTVAVMQVAMRARQAENEREEVLDRLEDEIEAAEAALSAASTDEAKAQAQAQVATLKAQLAELQNAPNLDGGDDEGEGDVDDAPDAPGDAKDGE